MKHIYKLLLAAFIGIITLHCGTTVSTNEDSTPEQFEANLVEAQVYIHPEYDKVRSAYSRRLGDCVEIKIWCEDSSGRSPSVVAVIHPSKGQLWYSDPGVGLVGRDCCRGFASVRYDLQNEELIVCRYDSLGAQAFFWTSYFPNRAAEYLENYYQVEMLSNGDLLIMEDASWPDLSTKITRLDSCGSTVWCTSMESILTSGVEGYEYHTNELSEGRLLVHTTDGFVVIGEDGQAIRDIHIDEHPCYRDVARLSDGGYVIVQGSAYVIRPHEDGVEDFWARENHVLCLSADGVIEWQTALPDLSLNGRAYWWELGSQIRENHDESILILTYNPALESEVYDWVEDGLLNWHSGPVRPGVSLVMVNSNGQVVWEERLYGSRYQPPIGFLSTEEIVLYGMTADSTSLWIQDIGEDGSIGTSRMAELPEGCESTDCIPTTDGCLLGVSVVSESASSTNKTLSVVKYDANATEIWSRVYRLDGLSSARCKELEEGIYAITGIVYLGKEGTGEAYALFLDSDGHVLPTDHLP